MCKQCATIESTQRRMEEFEDNGDKGQKADKNRVDDRSLRQRLDGGTVRTGLAIIALQGYKETV